MLELFGELPTAVLVAIGAVALVQITLQVYGLIDLARRPVSGVTLPKWIWALIILLGELVGAIAYLVAGRRPVPAEEGAAGAAGPPAPERAERAADILYGKKDRQ